MIWIMNHNVSNLNAIFKIYKLKPRRLLEARRNPGPILFPHLKFSKAWTRASDPLPGHRSSKNQSSSHPITLLSALSSSGEIHSQSGLRPARVIQIGDAAHSVMSNVNKCSFVRTACAQKLGFTNADLLQDTNWDKVKQNPRAAALRLPKWVWSHDPEIYAQDQYDKTVRYLERVRNVPLVGGENLPENYPRGYVYEKWSVEQIMEDKRNGRQTALGAGDWA